MKKVNPYIILLLVYFVAGGLIYWFFPIFANSNFVVASATVVVGSLAFVIYSKQKIDERTNAATTILLEIRNAESVIDVIIDKLDKKNAIDLPRVLPVNSWRIYSHLFVKDFDLDDIQLLNAFYSACEVIEDLAYRQNNFVWITTEERARAVQKTLATIHDDFQKDTVVQDPLAQKKFDARKHGLSEFYSNESLSYAPDKILKGLKFQTENIKRITSTPCGAKLKQFAHLS